MGLPLNLYNLLPGFYRLYDAERGEPLKKFLEPFQEALDRIYDDEKILRTVQDPLKTPERFLRWIALSLAWEFISQDPEAQRNELLEVINFYDLKGTPYVMRLLAALSFPAWFERLVEYYPGTPASVSTILEPWPPSEQGLKEALAGTGQFLDNAWLTKRLAERGRPYDLSESNRFYHYVIFNEVPPNSFQPGELRAAVLRFIRIYERFHPAGRYCYLYFKAPSGAVPDHGAAVIEELCGGLYWDLGWQFDTGRVWDAPADPVHPSVSWHFPWTMVQFDTSLEFDTGWTWDMGDLNAHVLIELN